jgi:hypothetical protein
MEGHSMLMGQQKQYCKNGYPTKSNLYVQCNPYQNSNYILYQDIKVNPKVHMEAQKTSKAILSQKSNTGGITTPDFKLYSRPIVLKTTSYWHKKQT